MTKQAHAAAEKIQALINNNDTKIGMVLGSGLSTLCEDMEIIQRIPYSELPGFHQCSVAGHAGELVVANLDGVPVVCLCGRPHYYEGAKPEVFKTMLRTLKLLGCAALVITNAAGSLDPKAEPGTLMLIEDHINFQGMNPFFGCFGIEDEEFGPRFLSVDNVYDPKLRACVQDLATKHDIPLSTGVYVGVQGPIFETHAEIRAYRMLGANAVGMSTVPDVIVAHQCGMRVLTLSVLTNWGAGMSDTILSHDVTIDGAKLGHGHAKKLLHACIGDVYSICKEDLANAC